MHIHVYVVATCILDEVCKLSCFGPSYICYHTLAIMNDKPLVTDFVIGDVISEGSSDVTDDDSE